MGKMKEVVIEIQELIQNSKMDFDEIARYLDVPVQMVYQVAESMGEFDD